MRPENLALTEVGLGRTKLIVNSNGRSKNASVVRTEFVVKNIFGYLLENEFYLGTVPAQTSAESNVLKALKDVVDVFKASYAESMSKLSASLEITPEIAESVILGVANELFCEGVNWARIASFFVFASELCIQCLRKGFPTSMVEDILECSTKYVKETLQKWINDHGGWEGIIEFSSGRKNKAASELPKPNINGVTNGTGWARSAIYGTVRLLGALAQFASFSDPVLSFPMNSE